MGCYSKCNRSERNGCGCNGCGNLTPFGIIRAVSRIGCCNRSERSGCGYHEHNYGCGPVRREADVCGCNETAAVREKRYIPYCGTGCGCGD
ncbi:MAG: hypothetical protein IJD17_03765 [Clostridia bacterium]|nr:hypothetical protein [Clostridia bacterium]